MQGAEVYYPLGEPDEGQFWVIAGAALFASVLTYLFLSRLGARSGSEKKSAFAAHAIACLVACGGLVYGYMNCFSIFYGVRISKDRVVLAYRFPDRTTEFGHADLKQVRERKTTEGEDTWALLLTHKSGSEHRSVSIPFEQSDRIYKKLQDWMRLSWSPSPPAGK